MLTAKWANIVLIFLSFLINIYIFLYIYLRSVFYAIESRNKVTFRTANESAKGLQHGVTHSEGLFSMLSFSVLLMKFLIAETFNPNGLKARQPTDKH